MCVSKRDRRRVHQRHSLCLCVYVYMCVCGRVREKTLEFKKVFRTAKLGLTDSSMVFRVDAITLGADELTASDSMRGHVDTCHHDDREHHVATILAASKMMARRL